MGSEPTRNWTDILADENVLGETFDSLPGIFYLIDDQDRFLRWNRNFETVSGYAPEEIARLSPTDLFDGPDKTIVAEKIRAVFLTGDASAEAGFVAKDRTKTPYFFTGKRLQIGGKPCLVGLGIDITARKRAENKFRDMIKAAPDASIMANRDGRIVLVNAKTEAMFGYDRAEMLGQRIEMLIPHRYREKHSEQFDGYFAHPKARPMGVGLEQFGQRKNGEEFPVEISLIPITTEAGLMVSAAIRDITSRKQAEQELQEFGMAMDVSADSIYLTDPATMRFVYLNNAACRRLGYTRNQLLQMGPQDVLPVDREKLRNEYASVIAADDEGIVLERQFVRSDGTKGISELHRRALHTKARTLIVTIGRDITDRKQAEERVRRLNRVYAVLSGINGAIVRIHTREELFSEACRIVVGGGGFLFAWVGLLDATSGNLEIVASAGDDRGFLKTARFSLTSGSPADSSLIADVIRTRKAMICNDVENDSGKLVYRDALLERGVRSTAALPLLINGEGVGCVAFYAEEIGFFDQEEVRLLDELTENIAFCLDTIHKKEKLDYLVFYDQLTGMANRALFLERVSRSIRAASRNNGKFVLVTLDIERLGNINESLGRQAGDALLKLVAERLMSFGGSRNVGRTSMAHFALNLGEVNGRSHAARLVHELLQRCFSTPFRAGDAELRISAKAGVALYPGDGNSAEQCLENAEAALRTAKKMGERHVTYASTMTERSGEKLTLENKLRQALEKNEFVLHYQPKVDVETRRIVDVEALIRWQSPELGLVPPMKFIPLMEETGLLLEVGPWALRQAAADHRRWIEEGLRAPRVAVNISAIQLRQRGFVEAVRSAVAEGLTPTGIDLEITESLVMEDIEGNIEKLNDLRGLGMRIAIDDFGTGYSSLAYLAKLPVHALKIDRSFIITMMRDPNTMTLISMMISLARSLKLKVIAEGVDEEEQAKTLRLLRCDEMQGYLICKPLPFEQITGILKGRAGNGRVN